MLNLKLLLLVATLVFKGFPQVGFFGQVCSYAVLLLLESLVVLTHVGVLLTQVIELPLLLGAKVVKLLDLAVLTPSLYL